MSRMSTKFARALFASTCLLTASSAWVHASLAADAMATVADGIGGVVTSSKGPEAGVWVIAETHDLPTRLIKIVVTDDQGRYMLPELPKAKYEVWVRGYGLIDGKHVEGTPGKNVNLTATLAPDAKSAAQYYPANYWFALIKPPAESEFPGTGPKGNGISVGMKTQQMWLEAMKSNCIQCHQQGDSVTRTLLNNSPEGWAERITKARPAGDHVLGDHGKDFANNMGNIMSLFGRARGLQMWAEYTQRIEKGALPTETPPRPQGLERNIVLTSWDWANGRYVHDNVSTDRHDPRVNANGPIYGVIGMAGYIEALDPVTGKQDEVSYKILPGKGAERLPDGAVPDAFPHNPMLDTKGRVWITDLGRYGAPKPTDNWGQKPAYCTDASNKYAKFFPEPGEAKVTTVIYDPKTKKVEGIPMCNGMHHLMFNVDQKTLYLSGGDNKVVSWIDTKVWDDTHDAQKALGWCPMVLDTNGDGKITPDRTQWNQPAAVAARSAGEEGGGGAKVETKVDPAKDTRIEGFLYGVDADIHDGSMWFAKTAPFPTSLVKFTPGNNPPETCMTENWEPPKLPNSEMYAAHSTHGVSVDSKGVAWASFGSGQLGRFERTKCKVTKGPAVADGQQCPEGWSFFDSPGPKIQGVKVGSADYHYLMWVDLHDTLGMGKDVPIVAGSNSDSLLAFNDATKKWTVLRVPYPMSFHTRGMDGRFENVNTGWKGKGVFATYASEPVWHQEGGDDGLSGPQLVKFQVRPDPLAH